MSISSNSAANTAARGDDVRDVDGAVGGGDSAAPRSGPSPSSDVVLGRNQYGKAEVRLVRVDRESPRHRLHDLTITSMLRGDYAACYTEGDNSDVIATDTQKNTVYAFAREHGVAGPEEFLLLLGRHFIDQPQVEGGRWSADEHLWRRIPVDGEGHDHSFVRDGTSTRTAAVTIVDGVEHVLGGFRDLTLLKTTGSEFSGFPRDRYTTLPETDDRVMATDVSARWLFRRGVHHDAALDFAAVHDAVRSATMETFATLHSESLQQTLHAAGRAALDRVPEIEDIRFEMPNNHHYLVDLSPFELDNPQEVFQAGDRPYGLMNASVTRADAVPRPEAWEWIAGFC